MPQEIMIFKILMERFGSYYYTFEFVFCVVHRICFISHILYNY